LKLKIFFAFADDSFILKCSNSLEVLIIDVEKASGANKNWMKSLGLKVNRVKKEACLFYKRDCALVRLKMAEDTIMTK
jgi:hypothetical protein